MNATESERVKRFLELAARAAWRAGGRVEPNPLVGCVIARDDTVLGIGHHQRFGGLHAEREALANAKLRGNDVRDATAYVTLEPCAHHGRTPPCADAPCLHRCRDTTTPSARPLPRRLLERSARRQLRR